MKLHVYTKSVERKRALLEARGFSLIEVLVSLSIFTIVVTIAVGSLMVLITANSRAQHSQEIMTDMSYMMDSMTREIRTGTDFFCSSGSPSLPTGGEERRDCTNGGTMFAFNEGGDSLTEGMGSRRVGYRLNAGTIERRLGTTGGWAPITSPDVSITDLRFHVYGAGRNDDITPVVTLYVAGTTGDVRDDTEAAFNIQTTVVQQLLDI